MVVHEVDAPRVAAVLLAGGSGSRVGGATNKALLPLAGEPMLVHSVRTVLDLPSLHRLLVVVRDIDREAVEHALVPVLGRTDAWVVPGGSSRHASEVNALAALRRDIDAGEVDLVALHDAARPLATLDLWHAVLAAAADGGAVPVVAAGPLLATDAGGGALQPVDDLVAVQTPQAFRADLLLAAYDAAARDGFEGTDTAACVEAHAAGARIAAVAGERTNLKITWPEDLGLAEALLRPPGR